MVKTLCVAFVIGALGATGCDLVTAPDPLEEFSWESVESAETIAEGLEATGLGGEITFLGQFTTTSLCYTLSSEFHRSGNNLQLDVTGKQSTSPTCAGTANGGFRYTGVLRHLGPGTYNLTATNVVPGQATKTFSKQVVIN